MIEFAVERAMEIEDEIRTLLVPEHAAEFDMFTPPLVTIVDYALYTKADREGRLLTVTARDKGRLVGYWIGASMPDAHHHLRSQPVSIIAGQVFHILRQYRARAARSMFCFIEREAAKRGAQLVAQSVRPGMSARSGAFLRAVGYKPTAEVYMKLVGDAANA